MTMCDPGTSSAATIGKAAEEGSPGTTISCGFNSVSPSMDMIRVPSVWTSTSSFAPNPVSIRRSEEHTSELQSLMRISYAVFCLKKKTHDTTKCSNNIHITETTKKHTNSNKNNNQNN